MKNNVGKDYFFTKCNTYQAKKKKLKEDKKNINKYGEKVVFDKKEEK